MKKFEWTGPLSVKWSRKGHKPSNSIAAVRSTKDATLMTSTGRSVHQLGLPRGTVEERRGKGCISILLRYNWHRWCLVSSRPWPFIFKRNRCISVFFNYIAFSDKAYFFAEWLRKYIRSLHSQVREPKRGYRAIPSVLKSLCTVPLLLCGRHIIGAFFFEDDDRTLLSHAANLIKSWKKNIGYRQLLVLIR